MKRFIGGVVAAFATCLSPAHAAGVVAVSPQGEVAQVRQVTVRFSEAVVAFGDPRLADPFTLTCPARHGGAAAGSDRLWLYDFREPLGPGSPAS